VKLTVTAADGYTYSLSASRRIYAGAGNPPNPGPGPQLLTLGGGGLSASSSGGGSLTVNGKVVVNSSGNPAVRRTNNAALNASGGIEIVSPGTCSGCTATSRSLPLADPYAGLPLPDEAPFVTAGKVFTDGNPSHGPGVYRNTALTFDSTTAPLASGIYIVESGFRFQGTDARIAGPASGGVLLFNGCGLNAPGSCQNNGNFQLTSGNLDLEPINDGSVYAQAGLVLWQPAANTTNMNIGGGSQASSIDGLIYAPTADLTLSAGAAGLDIHRVVAKSVNVTGNGAVTIG
jgi:hypothetical protein